MRRAAGVEDEDGDPRILEELPQRGAVHQLAVPVEIGILEEEIAVLAFARSGQDERVETLQEHAEPTGLLYLYISTVAVEVDHVVGLALPVRLAERLPELLEGGGRRTSRS